MNENEVFVNVAVQLVKEPDSGTLARRGHHTAQCTLQTTGNNFIEAAAHI